MPTAAGTRPPLPPPAAAAPARTGGGVSDHAPSWRRGLPDQPAPGAPDLGFGVGPVAAVVDDHVGAAGLLLDGPLGPHAGPDPLRVGAVAGDGPGHGHVVGRVDHPDLVEIAGAAG